MFILNEYYLYSFNLLFIYLIIYIYYKKQNNGKKTEQTN
jgi:hypothetical protein